MNTNDLDFAYKVGHALNDSLDNLPASSATRLSFARKMALSKKRTASARDMAILHQVGGTANSPLLWAGRFGIAIPLLVGALLFVGLLQFEQQQRISDMAEIDAGVLSDDLPLSAYLDRGFNAYLANRAQ